MPKSTPFGFVYMYIFYDAGTKYIAVYFGKSTQSGEMRGVYNHFIADHKRYMKYGHVEEWVADGGPEFTSKDLDKFIAEQETRMKLSRQREPIQAPRYHRAV